MLIDALVVALNIWLWWWLRVWVARCRVQLLPSGHLDIVLWLIGRDGRRAVTMTCHSPYHTAHTHVHVCHLLLALDHRPLGPRDW